MLIEHYDLEIFTPVYAERRGDPEALLVPMPAIGSHDA